MYSKITYYHTLYKRNVEEIVCGAIEFEYCESAKEVCAVFAHFGRMQMIPVKDIKKIEPMGD